MSKSNAKASIPRGLAYHSPDEVTDFEWLTDENSGQDLFRSTIEYY